MINKNKKNNQKNQFSIISMFHYVRLFYRFVLFVITVVWYLDTRFTQGTVSIRNNIDNPFLFVLWGVYMLEMIFRFFPSNIESPGCQKQFKKNYISTGKTEIKLHDNNAVMIVAIIWIIGNAIFGALHMINLFDDGIMLIICMVYSVCDMVCILFFCPFQTWFLKNRCCSTCRIYNWDYAMMFTPLFFVPGVYTWTLLIASVLLMLRWEITVWRYPERFSENTNQYISCANCNEKLCKHKKQLTHFWKELTKYTERQVKRILANDKKN